MPRHGVQAVLPILSALGDGSVTAFAATSAAAAGSPSPGGSWTLRTSSRSLGNNNSGRL
jgi:hypothetical protein